MGVRGERSLARVACPVPRATMRVAETRSPDEPTGPREARPDDRLRDIRGAWDDKDPHIATLMRATMYEHRRPPPGRPRYARPSTLAPLGGGTGGCCPP